VLELSRGLPARALEAIADLERRTVAVDGGRLKLEWGELRSRPADKVQDLLWWDGDQLLGFLGLYGFAAPTVELAGMVDPQARRRGIATSLLDAAQPVVRQLGYRKALLVVPRPSAAGAALARVRGGALEHSEHALVLRGDPVDGPTDPRITTREATRSDAAVITRLLAAAFDWQPPDVESMIDAGDARMLLIDLGDVPVGTVRLTLDAGSGGVYGLVVAPPWRGQGIGRQALREFCRMLRADGAQQVQLEVAVENERALGLYTSLGFEPVQTED
jgi:ribosomal protein S18 acetylase RimI-like enzyme